jgi:hypothetical protein
LLNWNAFFGLQDAGQQQEIAPDFDNSGSIAAEGEWEAVWWKQ